MNKGLAVTIGFFDGVHLGHAFLLHQLEVLAAEKGLEPAAVTFDRHPKAVLGTECPPSLLTTQQEKLALLAQTFAGTVTVLPFTQELSRLTAREFMQTVLCQRLHTRFLLMGYNHRFGHGGGTMDDYIAWGKELGITVCRAEPLEGEKVSSSRIRTLLASGEIEKANAMLGHPYFLTGTVVRGKQIGRQIGFPTANISAPPHKLIPASGAYAVEVSLPDGSKRSGMLSIGRRPTIENNGEISIEVHILDFEGCLYNSTISAHFIGKIRDEQHFPSLLELQRQLHKDALAARLMTEHPA